MRTPRAASQADIRVWLAEYLYGAPDDVTHLIIVCDEYDWSDYPVQVRVGQDPREVKNGLEGKDLQRVMEVYSRSHGIEEQLAEKRAFHYD